MSVRPSIHLSVTYHWVYVCVCVCLCPSNNSTISFSNNAIASFFHFIYFLNFYPMTPSSMSLLLDDPIRQCYSFFFFQIFLQYH